MGPVRTNRPGSNTPYGFDWSQVSRWEDLFLQADLEFGIDPLDLAPMAIIESDANQYVTGATTGTRSEVIVRSNDGTGVPSVGMMQVKPHYHQWRVPDADAYTPMGNVRMAAALLREAVNDLGSFERAIRERYFPYDDPNGTSQDEYIATWKSLKEEMAAAGNPIVITVDPYEFMFGGTYPVNYGWLDDAGLDYYDYGEGHGTERSTQHTGDDVLTPFGTPIFAPAAGVVDCVGTRGTPRWGQNCGAYTDTGTAGPGAPELGVGNITILLDSGHKLTLGHCRTALVNPGDRVQPGQPIGTTGGQNGAHCHVEVSINRNGTYWLVDPKAALIEAMKGAPVDTRTRVAFAGTNVSVPLDVPFRAVLIPAAQVRQRPGQQMNPDRIIVHETANYNVGADAEMHLRYLQNGAEGQKLGYHFTVDQDEIIQMIPVTEITWHGGDGNGVCNMRGISIETCVHEHNRYKERTRDNLAKLVAALKQATGVQLVEMHRHCCERLDPSRRGDCHMFCPEKIQEDNYWFPLLDAIRRYEASGTSQFTAPTFANPESPPEWDGTDKVVDGVTFHALRRRFTALKDGIPVLQYADLRSSPVREPLRKGESFEGWYWLVAGNKPWIVSRYGSRIPADDLSPAVSVEG